MKRKTAHFYPKNVTRFLLFSSISSVGEFLKTFFSRKFQKMFIQLLKEYFRFYILENSPTYLRIFLFLLKGNKRTSVTVDVFLCFNIPTYSRTCFKFYPAFVHTNHAQQTLVCQLVSLYDLVDILNRWVTQQKPCVWSALWIFHITSLFFKCPFGPFRCIGSGLAVFMKMSIIRN